jgi:hypothetical protein
LIHWKVQCHFTLQAGGEGEVLGLFMSEAARFRE